ncbi:FAD-binding oxidoreductase [Gammaproteobacteria bacterium]|nr:FAD-binding oxidoreductase [Gammaproteobacteria bacterium]
MADLREQAGEEFVTGFRGDLVVPSDEGYDEARAVYNAMINRHPGMVARCRDVADVMSAVNLARDKGWALAIRGGGHNGAGLGTCDDGLVIDLSPMKGIHIDRQKRSVRVQAGCTWGDVDHATHAFGLAVPGGVISTTGISGLTLGGGIGHLSRKYGLSIDNLLEVDVVLADGSFVSASAEQNEDLFWALRGGGGNFGVVTSLLFQAHPVKDVVAGPTLWPLDMAADVMRFFSDFFESAPDDINGTFAFLTVPPGPPFPEEIHMEKMCAIVWCYTGPPEQADEIFAPVRDFGPPALHGVQSMPFPALQTAFDALYPPGDQWYWRADFVNELTDEAIALHVEHARKLPTLQSGMHLYPIDAAVHRVGKDDTAFSFRDTRWAGVIFGVDGDPANANLIKTWSTEYWDALHPYSAGGAYVNFMMDEGQSRVQATYQDNYDRLVQVKNRYDPNNLFRINQNIQPGG